MPALSFLEASGAAIAGVAAMLLAERRTVHCLFRQRRAPWSKAWANSHSSRLG